jgi:hypothetical protein
MVYRGNLKLNLESLNIENLQYLGYKMENDDVLRDILDIEDNSERDIAWIAYTRELEKKIKMLENFNNDGTEKGASEKLLVNKQAEIHDLQLVIDKKNKVVDSMMAMSARQIENRNYLEDRIKQQDQAISNYQQELSGLKEAMVDKEIVIIAHKKEISELKQCMILQTNS